MCCMFSIIRKRETEMYEYRQYNFYAIEYTCWETWNNQRARFWLVFIRATESVPTVQDKYYEDEYEKRHWWNRNVNVIKNDYYWAKKIAHKSQDWCMCIKISADSEKCVELLIIDNIWMEFRDRDKNLALKLSIDVTINALSVNSALSQTNIMTKY